MSVVNPHTKRKIKIGGSVYKRLVKKGDIVPMENIDEIVKEVEEVPQEVKMDNLSFDDYKVKKEPNLKPMAEQIHKNISNYGTEDAVEEIEEMLKLAISEL